MVVEKLVLGVCDTNCYIVYDEQNKEGIIIDPAASPVEIDYMLTKLGVKPVAMLLTHGHFDHFLAVDELRAKYNIDLYANIDEKIILNDENMNLSASFTGVGCSIDADKYISEGEQLDIAGFDIVPIAIAGHTIGGMCYYFEDEKTLFSGDTLFAGSVGRYDFPTGDGRKLLRQIKEKLFPLPEDTIVYSGHGRATTIGYEIQNNPFF